MALIKCPECGKEKVSDSAEMCPDCGYGIKAHFARIEEEKEKRRAQIERITAQEQRTKNVPKPQKPIFSKGFTIYIIFVISLSFILCIVEPIITKDNNVNFLGFCLEILFWIGLPLAVYGRDFKKKLDAYHLAQRDFEKYQKQIAREQERTQAIMEMQASAHARQLANRPKCPYCSSRNTVKITTAQKVINVALFGIFGQKRKHYWHCNSCNSDF